MANSSVEYDSLIRSFIDDRKFVSRDWLAAEVLDSLTNPQTTFVLLTAESGAGKTGLSASLAHAHPDWLRYFIRRDSRTPLSSGDAVSFLFSIGNELAMRCPKLFRPDKLEVVIKQRIDELQSGARAVALTVDDLYVSPFYRTAIDVEQEVGIVGGNLEAMVVKRMVAEKRFLEIENLQYLALLDPAKVLEQQEPTAVIVILIDGLDEIRPSAEQRSLLDWLASSPAMPANIKFVLTSRNDTKSLFQTTFQLTYYLNALNHGMERRAWRVFDRPIDLLYDLLAPPRLNAAPYFVERTLRRFVEAATTVDVNVAQNLTELIKNEAELAIAYAAIFDSTAKKDWDFAAQFAGAALQLIENVDATSAEILSEQFEILRWTNRNVRNRMETAMHLGRYHPPSMQQIMEAVDSKIMTLYLSFQMISKTVEAESAGMLESGTSLDDVIRFHLSTMALLAVASDTTPGWVMAGYVLRTLAQYDLEKARIQVARFPVDGLGALLRIKVASGIVASNPSQASTWLREAVESLEADVTTSHRASVFGRAAAVIVQTDAPLAGEWATEAMKNAGSISDPLQRGYAFIDLLRQEGLHSLVGQQVLLSELDECLVNSSSPDIEAELAMHAFPVLLELNPARALNLFSSVASSHWITLLALLDHGAEKLTKVCGAANLPSLANALDAAMAYLPSGLSGRN